MTAKAMALATTGLNNTKKQINAFIRREKALICFFDR